MDKSRNESVSKSHSTGNTDVVCAQGELLALANIGQYS